MMLDICNYYRKIFQQFKVACVRYKSNSNKFQSGISTIKNINCFNSPENLLCGNMLSF